MGENPLKTFTILIRARDAQDDFHVMYEVIAPDAEQAARFALADMAARRRSTSSMWNTRPCAIPWRRRACASGRGDVTEARRRRSSAPG
ncbi:MAG: hypothetical protein EBZ50_12265 [Alphaproteobacteria bacterium]|nr:hypothetical protein [Alphaproteobacteria bacterium]